MLVGGSDGIVAVVSNQCPQGPPIRETPASTFQDQRVLNYPGVFSVRGELSGLKVAFASGKLRGESYAAQTLGDAQEIEQKLNPRKGNTPDDSFE